MTILSEVLMVYNMVLSACPAKLSTDVRKHCINQLVQCVEADNILFAKYMNETDKSQILSGTVKRCLMIHAR